MTTDAETWALVDDQRRRTIALLGSLSPADWDAPSLCSDWTVKDVVGHLAWQRAASSASSLPGTIAAMLRGRGSMDAAISDLATRWAARRSVDELLGEVRLLPGHHRTVIGTTVINHLIDAIVGARGCRSAPVRPGPGLGVGCGRRPGDRLTAKTSSGVGPPLDSQMPSNVSSYPWCARGNWTP